MGIRPGKPPKVQICHNQARAAIVQGWEALIEAKKIKAASLFIHLTHIERPPCTNTKKYFGCKMWCRFRQIILSKMIYLVTSLDIVSKTGPNPPPNLMDWDYTKYPPGHFEIIMASYPRSYVN